MLETVIQEYVIYVLSILFPSFALGSVKNIGVILCILDFYVADIIFVKNIFLFYAFSLNVMVLRSMCVATCKSS